ncbi:MAG TPA: GNAT family N-acetyltransferase, partial [Solirubrobacteraceae bacterium]
RRLILRAPADSDEQNYRALLLAPEVSRWLRPAPLPALADPDPALWLARDIAHWHRHGFGTWTLSDRQSAAFIGRAGLAYTTLEKKTVIEVAWALMPSRWGSGLASEAAGEALRWAAELGLSEVVSFTTPTNIASRRVMEKAGLQFCGEIQRAGIAHVLFRLTRTP